MRRRPVSFAFCSANLIVRSPSRALAFLIENDPCRAASQRVGNAAKINETQLASRAALAGHTVNGGTVLPAIR